MKKPNLDFLRYHKGLKGLLLGSALSGTLPPGKAAYAAPEPVVVSVSHEAEPVAEEVAAFTPDSLSAAPAIDSTETAIDSTAAQKTPERHPIYDEQPNREPTPYDIDSLIAAGEDPVFNLSEMVRKGEYLKLTRPDMQKLNAAGLTLHYTWEANAPYDSKDEILIDQDARWIAVNGVKVLEWSRRARPKLYGMPTVNGQLRTDYRVPISRKAVRNDFLRDYNNIRNKRFRDRDALMEYLAENNALPPDGEGFWEIERQPRPHDFRAIQHYALQQQSRHLAYNILHFQPELPEGYEYDARHNQGMLAMMVLESKLPHLMGPNLDIYSFVPFKTKKGTLSWQIDYSQNNGLGKMSYRTGSHAGMGQDRVENYRASALGESPLIDEEGYWNCFKVNGVEITKEKFLSSWQAQVYARLFAIQVAAHTPLNIPDAKRRPNDAWGRAAIVHLVGADENAYIKADANGSKAKDYYALFANYHYWNAPKELCKEGSRRLDPEKVKLSASHFERIEGQKQDECAEQQTLAEREWQVEQTLLGDPTLQDYPLQHYQRMQGQLAEAAMAAEEPATQEQQNTKTQRPPSAQEIAASLNNPERAEESSLLPAYLATRPKRGQPENQPEPERTEGGAGEPEPTGETYVPTPEDLRRPVEVPATDAQKAPLLLPEVTKTRQDAEKEEPKEGEPSVELPPVEELLAVQKKQREGEAPLIPVAAKVPLPSMQELLTQQAKHPKSPFTLPSPTPPLPPAEELLYGKPRPSLPEVTPETGMIPHPSAQPAREEQPDPKTELPSFEEVWAAHQEQKEAKRKAQEPPSFPLPLPDHTPPTEEQTPPAGLPAPSEPPLPPSSPPAQPPKGTRQQDETPQPQPSSSRQGFSRIERLAMGALGTGGLALALAGGESKSDPSEKKPQEAKVKEAKFKPKKRWFLRIAGAVLGVLALDLAIRQDKAILGPATARLLGKGGNDKGRGVH